MGFWEVIAIMVVVNAVAKIVRARSRGGRSALEAADTEELHRRIDEQGDSLADAHSRIADQSLQIEELHERLEFTERLLSQVRDRPELGAGPTEPT